MSKHTLFTALHHLYWFVILLGLLLITVEYLDGLYWEEPRLAFSELLQGTAHKPFVYRVFVPLVTRIAVSVFPLQPTLYASFFIYLFLLGFVVCIRWFSLLFWKEDAINDFIGISSLITLTPFMLTNRHVYDFSTLFLFSLALVLMARRKWTYFLVCYALACLNKETTILLSLVFLFHFRHHRKDRLFWKLLGSQIAIYTCIRLAILWRFQNNPGVMMEHHLDEHLLFVRAYPFLALGYFIFIILAALAIKKDWDKKPVFLREAAMVLVPSLFGLYLLGAGAFELRVFYELYPVVYLLASPTLGQVFGLDFFRGQSNLSPDLRRSLSDLS